MSAAIQTIGTKVENVLINGDLKTLSPEERVSYYNRVCESLGLNTLTRPLEYVTLNGKLTLYARKDAADQLRKIHSVSIDNVTVLQVGELYVVTVNGSCGNRKDSATGVINIKGLSGEALANAMMKAETKAKRRLTLSICGLGLLDETEVEDAQNTMAQEKVVESAKRFEEPPPPQITESSPQGEEHIAVKTAYGEREKQQQLKSMGFRWDAGLKVWTAKAEGFTQSMDGIDHEIIFI